MTNQRSMSALHAYVEECEPLVNNLTSLWTQTCIFEVHGPKVTPPYKLMDRRCILLIGNLYKKRKIISCCKERHAK